MELLSDGKINVKKFCVDDTVDRLEYEKILNDPTCTILRDESTYDRMGKFLITVWWTDGS